MAKLTPVYRRPTTERKGIYDDYMRSKGLNPDEVELLTDDELEDYLAEDISKFESFTTGVGESAGAGLGGAVGAIGAGAALSATGVGALVGVPLMIGGGLLGAYLGSEAQQGIEGAVYDDDELRQLQQDRMEARLANPLSSFAGQVAPSLVAFRPDPRLLKSALTGTGKATLARPLAQAETAALAQSAIGGGLEAGIEGVGQYARGDFDAGRLAGAFGVGSLLQKPTFKPKVIDDLIKRRESAAIARGADPSKFFNIYREPLPSSAELTRSIRDTAYVHKGLGDEAFIGTEGTHVGSVENRLTTTPVDGAATIEREVTGGVGFLDPTAPGPAAQSMRRPGVGIAPMTAEEAAKGYGVAPSTLSDIYGGAEKAAQKATEELDRLLPDLDTAQRKLQNLNNNPQSKKSAINKAQSAVNKLQKQVNKATAIVETTPTMSATESRELNKLFRGRSEPVKDVDPTTGKPITRRVIEVDPAASRRLVDRNGEPLDERIDVWRLPALADVYGEGAATLGSPVRILDNGSVQLAVRRKDGSTSWRFASAADAKKVRQHYLDHIEGTRKNAEREIELIRQEEASRAAAIDKLYPKPKPKELKPLDEDVLIELAKLAAVRGFNITEAIRRGIYRRTPDGRLVRQAGFAAYDTRNITFDPRTATDDTIAHEGWHNFMDDLQYSTNKKDRKLHEDYLKLFRDEEEGVEFLGRALTQRLKTRKATGNQQKLRRLVREAKLRWMHKFGMRFSAKNLKDFMLIKYETDDPFLYNSDFIDGFAARRMGKERPTDPAEARAWDAERQKILNDVTAGNPIPAAAIGGVGSRDPWADLKFQEAKERFNRAGERAVSEEEGLDLMAQMKKTLEREQGMKFDEPAAGAPIQRIMQGIRQESGDLKFQEAKGERSVTESPFKEVRDSARYNAENFDKVQTGLEYFDAERAVMRGQIFGLSRLVQAETDQLILRPFEGLKNDEITDSTKRMALYARDAHNRLEMAEKRYVNMFVEPLLMRFRSMHLSKQEIQDLGTYRILRRLVKKFGNDSTITKPYADKYQKLETDIKLNRKLADANETLDKLYRETRAEQVANGPRIKVGNKYVRVEETQGDYYDPYMLSHDNNTLLRTKAHTKEGEELQEKILAFWLKQRQQQEGVKAGQEAELRDELAEYIAVISNKDSYVTTTGENRPLTTASKFGALRKGEGLLMPPDLVDADPFMRAQRYIGRFSKDMAWHTQIEGDETMRAIRDLPDDANVPTHRTPESEDSDKMLTPTLKEIFGDDVDAGYLARAQGTFKNLDEVHTGFHRKGDLSILRLNRLITSQWLGTLSGVRDFVNSFKNANMYMRTEDWPLVLKSLTHFQDSWKQSHISGANRSKLSRLEFAHDSVDRASDAMATVADLSQKYSGRELFERGTRAIQFNLGKLLMRSYLNNGTPDAHVKRMLNLMGRMGDVDTARLAKNPETTTEADLNKLATAWVEINQGTYGARGVPSWSIRGPSSWFTSLSRWSIEKYNRYLKDVVMPMTKGDPTTGKKDFKPFLKATLGSVVEANVLMELTEMINAKENYEPTTAELLESNAGFEDYVYHAMHMANMSGYFGLLSGLSNDAVRMIRTGKAAPEDLSFVTFPGFEALLADKGLAQTTFAYLNSGRETPTTMRFLEDVITNLNQTLRIARNQAIASSSLSKDIDRALGTTYVRTRAAEADRKGYERDLRIFNRLNKGEYGTGWFQNLNRYETTPKSTYQYSQTEEEMRDTLQDFMQSSWNRSQSKDPVTGKQILDRERFKSLLQQGYQKPKRISPRITKDPQSLRESAAFVDFINRLRGKDAVRNVINQEIADEVLAEKRKQLLAENLPNFLASKGY